ncbi:MAG: hypothetical protein ACHRXM_19405 [Isosphaerales bacterium]
MRFVVFQPVGDGGGSPWLEQAVAEYRKARDNARRDSGLAQQVLLGNKR